MRQIGDEFRHDPFTSIKVKMNDYPDLSGKLGAHYEVY